jgi:hypothetical protein
MIPIGGNGSTANENTLKVISSAGFFSCNTVCLRDIVNYINIYKRNPLDLNRSEQYKVYKTKEDSLIDTFFIKSDLNLNSNSPLRITEDTDVEDQFSNYKLINHDSIKDIISKYFQPSEKVLEIVSLYESKYNIDYNKTCAVFYRGNDKFKETKIADYNDFISKTREIQEENIRFLVQPDETEFLIEFQKNIENSFNIEETPHIYKSNTVIFNEIPPEQRAEYACYFFAAVIVISKCKYLITHSGNCGYWSVLYRGHSNNISQYLNGKWIN